MGTKSRLNKVYASAPVIPFNHRSKYVIMSDCHRGAGNYADNFLNNQNLFFAALSHYYQNGFTYIELGDGDELWENRNIQKIIEVHSDAFWLMSRFYKENRLYMLFGNHDIIKKYSVFGCKNCHTFYSETQQQQIPLFPDIRFYEGLRLQHKKSGLEIFLAHGHQGDLLNDTLWPVARFLVRYVWRPLELAAFHDPTSAARNNRKKGRVEKRLSAWSSDKELLFITGHTHRPSFPNPSEGRYFNDGSCVHPRCITAIEIERDCITLVKWSIQTNCLRTLFVGRTVLAGPFLINDFAPDDRV